MTTWRPSVTSEDVIMHSALGQRWKHHKYIAIKNGRYIYAKAKGLGKKFKKGVNNFIGYNITGNKHVKDAENYKKNIEEDARKRWYKRYDSRDYDRLLKIEDERNKKFNDAWEKKNKALIPSIKRTSDTVAFEISDVPDKIRREYEYRKQRRAQKKADKIRKLLAEYPAEPEKKGWSSY